MNRLFPFLSPLPALALLALPACAMHDLRAVPAGATVELPRDDGPHDDAQTEWWHVHAELRDVQTGEELRLFTGFVVERTDLDRVLFVPVPLGVNPFCAAYVRLATETKSWVADRENFPDFFTAGFGDEGLDVYHGDWRLRREAGALLLNVSAGPATANLRLTPTRAPVRPGAAGRVEMPAGAAHLWVQEERMEVHGKWFEGGRMRWVEGTAFAKHQWGRMYSPDVDGFQWISADLPDGRGLVVAWLEGGGVLGLPSSRAWLSAPDGTLDELDPTTLKLTPTRTWRSPRSGARWPVAWTVESDRLHLTIEAEQDAQELWVFPAAMWAGGARVRGTVDDEAVDLVGFAEQVGADKPPFRALFHSDAPPGSAVVEAPPPAEEEPLVGWTLVTGSETEAE